MTATQTINEAGAPRWTPAQREELKHMTEIRERAEQKEVRLIGLRFDHVMRVEFGKGESK